MTQPRSHLRLDAGHGSRQPAEQLVSGLLQSLFTGRFNLIDGEISTYAAFRDLIDVSIFIDSDWKTQLQTRIHRDIDTRGYTREKAIATFLQSNLHEAAFVQHIERLAEAGVQRILVNGTTGEFFSLTPDERRRLFLIARRYFPGAVLYQAGREGLRQTGEEIRWAMDRGAEALLVLPPYYYAGATEAGLIQYFTGDEAHVTDALAKGAAGVISGLANAFPHRFIALLNAIADVGNEEAARHQQALRVLRGIYETIPSIPALKSMIALLHPGFPSHVRPPLVEANPTQQEAIRQLIERDAEST